MAADQIDAGSLPYECLHHIYGFLDLRDRARGSLVCRHWAAALASGAVGLVEFTKEDPQGMWEWLLQRELSPARLCVTGLRDWTEVERLGVVLAHCLKRAKAFDFRAMFPSLHQVLPAAQFRAPVLQELCADYGVAWSADWAAALTQLPHLQHLQLRAEPEHAGQELVLPALPGLTSLKLHVSVNLNNHTEETVCFTACTLGPLPSLRRLEVETCKHDRRHQHAYPVDLRPAGLLPLLEELCMIVRSGPAALDFRCLPAVRAAHLWVPHELAGADTIAAALCLERLHLGDDNEDADGIILERPWAVTLLRELPRSVRGLSLCGRWGGGLAQALDGITQVQALGLYEMWVDWSDYPGGEAEPDGPAVAYPPASAPLWSSIRALVWFCDTPSKEPPQELRSAAQLELLEFGTFIPNDTPGICAALPMLRQLYLPWLQLEEVKHKQDKKDNRKKLAQLAAIRAAVPAGVVVKNHLLDRTSTKFWTNDFVREALAVLEAH